jgi:hypothetical protein
MRRLFLLASSALLLLTVVSPVAAATQYRYSVIGSGVWGSGVVQGDGRFEAAWVEIGDEARTDSDGAVYLNYVLFEHLLEICDARRCVTEYTAGIAEDVPFSIDRKKLASASVDVTIPAQRCVDDGRQVTCAAVEAHVDVTWAGFGEFIRSHGTATGGIAGEYQYTLNGAATERWATVTGSVNGFDLGDAGAIGALYRTRYAERTIVHG